VYALVFADTPSASTYNASLVESLEAQKLFGPFKYKAAILGVYVFAGIPKFKTFGYAVAATTTP